MKRAWSEHGQNKPDHSVFRVEAKEHSDCGIRSQTKAKLWLGISEKTVSSLAADTREDQVRPLWLFGGRVSNTDANSRPLLDFREYKNPKYPDPAAQRSNNE